MCNTRVNIRGHDMTFKYFIQFHLPPMYFVHSYIFNEVRVSNIFVLTSIKFASLFCQTSVFTYSIHSIKIITRKIISSKNSLKKKTYVLIFKYFNIKLLFSHWYLANDSTFSTGSHHHNCYHGRICQLILNL